MADDGIMVQAHIDGNSELGQQWKQHADSFENGSEALRQVLRDSFQEDGEVDQRKGDVSRGVQAGLATLLVIMLGQAHLVYGPAVSMPLVGTALLAFAIVLVVPQPLTDIVSTGSHE